MLNVKTCTTTGGLAGRRAARLTFNDEVKGLKIEIVIMPLLVFSQTAKIEIVL